MVKELRGESTSRPAAKRPRGSLKSTVTEVQVLVLLVHDTDDHFEQWASVYPYIHIDT